MGCEMKYGERIAEVNRLLTSGEKISQKKIAALAGVATGTVANAAWKLRQYGILPKWNPGTSRMASERAREMLLAGAGRLDIEQATGLTQPSIRSIASGLRKRGIDLPLAQKYWRYTGTNEIGQVVQFDSLSLAEAGGFNSTQVSLCINGKRASYAGYKWERVERNGKI